MADYSDFIKHRIDTLDTSLEEEESAKEDLEALKYEREEQLSKLNSAITSGGPENAQFQAAFS